MSGKANPMLLPEARVRAARARRLPPPGAPLVGDIELVVRPRAVRSLALFGEAHEIYPELDELLRGLGRGGAEFAKNGPRYKQFRWGGAKVDLWHAREDNWEDTLAIRTGNWRFAVLI